VTQKERKVVGWIVGWIVGVGLILIIPSCMGLFIPGQAFFIPILFGWVSFLGRVIPQVRIKWDLVLTAVLYAFVLILGSHLFLRWMYREIKRHGSGDGAVWRWRWTLSGAASVLLMFVAGMAAIGVTHQVIWLASSPEPLYAPPQSYRESRNRIKCGSNLRQLGIAIKQYARDHAGQYPDNFQTLHVSTDGFAPAEVFTCPSSNAERAPGTTPAEQSSHLSDPTYCSYVYHGAGLKTPVDGTQIIIVEFLTNHDYEGINVLFGDGHVEWTNSTEARALLSKLRVETRQPPVKE